MDYGGRNKWWGESGDRGLWQYGRGEDGDRGYGCKAEDDKVRAQGVIVVKVRRIRETKMGIGSEREWQMNVSLGEDYRVMVLW